MIMMAIINYNCILNSVGVLKIKLFIHINALPDQTKPSFLFSTELILIWLCCISVSALSYPALTVGSVVKTSPNTCVTSQMKTNTKCSLSCPQGYQLQGPSYKQCGSYGQWTDSAKSVSCIGELTNYYRLICCRSNLSNWFFDQIMNINCITLKVLSWNKTFR